VSGAVLQIDNLGKAFREYRMEWQRMLSWFGARPVAASEFWVLRGVGFQVEAGECVGIVGQNGAGKSTLLKLVTGTLRPTEGTVRVAGRIAAILELGMGFNPDLTGRDNARYTAGLMGMSPHQIDAIIPAVEEFAEIGEYFDQPLRTYSSGMQMRVAFSVVTAIRPEILIIDEALSVGDAYFSHKSMARIRRFREEGTTLLFVSHDPGAIQSL
jgi:lipopolysaccharide transport system ATP-binding protein